VSTGCRAAFDSMARLRNAAHEYTRVQQGPSLPWAPVPDVDDDRQRDEDLTAPADDDDPVSVRAFQRRIHAEF
jgi:hypothetical protein